MRFVVFDLEANADHPRPEDQEIIEIGALLVSDGEVVGEFASLVAPSAGRPLDPLTIELTGLTDEALKEAPARTPTLKRFLEFCGDLPLVAHNGSTYDFLLLFAELEQAGLAEPLGERLDTLELAHVVFPRAGRESLPDIRGGRPPRSRRLVDLAGHYGVGEDARPAHRALSDARTAWEVMGALLEDLNRDDPTRLAQRWLLEVAGHPWAMFCQPDTADPGSLYRPDLVEIIPLPPPSEEGMRAPVWPGADDDRPEEDEEEVDLTELVAPLTSGGQLVAGEMEHRPSQETMAREVAAALVNSEKLMVEAPTGTGKTLAYLIPACRLTEALGAQVLISTYTKALQDQVCLTLLDISEWMAPVRWTVLKGLGNYLSVNALAEELALVDPLDPGQLRDNPLFPDQASEPLSDHHLGLALAVVMGWVAETPTGEWDDLRDGWLRRHSPVMYRLRSRLSMTESPGRARGDLDKRCFFLRALKRLSEAQIVVANHSLMLVRDQMTAEIPSLGGGRGARVGVGRQIRFHRDRQRARPVAAALFGLWRQFLRKPAPPIFALPPGGHGARPRSGQRRASLPILAQLPASHRGGERDSGGLLGGNPGLVQRLGNGVVFFPDYQGRSQPLELGRGDADPYGLGRGGFTYGGRHSCSPGARPVVRRPVSQRAQAPDHPHRWGGQDHGRAVVPVGEHGVTGSPGDGLCL